MKRITKVAAFAIAVALLVSMAVGCSSKNEMADNLEVAIKASQKLIGLDSGELMVYETVKLEKDVEGHAVNSVTESYAKFALNGESLEYDLNATYTKVNGGDITSYHAMFENGTFTHSINLEPVADKDMAEPDIFERFRIDYTADDVINVDLVQINANRVIVVVEMSEEYANTFDYERDGVKYDCTGVINNYQLGEQGILRQVLSEQKAIITSADGSSQEVVKLSQATSE